MTERLHEEDRLKLMLSLEKQGRLRAEERILNMQRQVLEAEMLRAQSESMGLHLQLREKYKLQAEDTLDAATGAVTRKAATP